MKQVVVAMTGGLGNQLFQLAAGIAVGEALSANVSTNCQMYDVPLRKRIGRSFERLLSPMAAGEPRGFKQDAAARRAEFDSLIAGLRDSRHVPSLPRCSVSAGCSVTRGCEAATG